MGVKEKLEPGFYRLHGSPTATRLRIDEDGHGHWQNDDGTEDKSDLPPDVFARADLVREEEGEGEEVEVEKSLVGRYKLGKSPLKLGLVGHTIGYEVREDGTKWWLYEGGKPGRSGWGDEDIQKWIDEGNFIRDDNEEGDGSVGDEAKKSDSVKVSARGWKVGDTVRWTAPVVDAREWGEVTEILKNSSYKDGYAVQVKWDTGRTEAYLCDEQGRIHKVDDTKKVSDATVAGMRREKDRVEKLNIRKRDKPKDVEIVREGNQIILPPGMSFADGITWLTRKKEADEKEIAIMEVVDAIPLEGAYAFKRALDRTYGFTALVNTPSFFGEKPPVMIGVEVEHGKTEQVPWGRMSVPGIAGYFETGITLKDGQFKFVIQGKTKQKNKGAVETLAALTRKISREESIYKGKAIRMKFPPAEKVEQGSVGPLDYQPKFIPLEHVVEEDLIFPADVQDLVETAIFVPIEKRERCKAEGIPFKRGILLEGPWGVGKTLTADVTAKKATRQGVTFIYLENVKDLEQGLRFANLYAPAVVFAEDIDQVGKDDRHDEESPLNDILNTLDGVDMKNSEIMAVLTTNYINEIEQGLLRPGRIDAVIPVRPPDAPAAIRLVQLYSRGRLAAGTNLEPVGRKLAGQIPAVIREVVERAKLEAIGRIPVDSDEPLALTAKDLERASNSMLTHLELLKPKKKDTRSPREKAAAILAGALEKNAEVAQTIQQELVASMTA